MGGSLLRPWSWLWCLVFASACGGPPADTLEPPTDTVVDPTDDTPPPPPPPPPPPEPVDGGDPIEDLTVVEVVVTQLWLEHEAQIDVALSVAAPVAVACQLDGDPSEVHLVEGTSPATRHSLRLAGLLAASTYHCSVAPVFPGFSDPPFAADLVTGPVSNPLVPELVRVSKDPRASLDYLVTNNQHTGTWNGQRMLAIDRDANVRWHSIVDAGGGVRGSAVGYAPATRTFTIGGGWPATRQGRPQELDLYGSTVVYDTLDVLSVTGVELYHHDARQLSDGRFLTLEERVVFTPGGRFDGFGVTIVNPRTSQVDFTWSSQGAFDSGALPSGNGDAYHPNWANVIDGTLHVSLCYLGAVAAVDVPSGEWRWLFGPGGDFALVDTTGAPLPDSEYSQCQHGLQRRGDKLLVYDNGHDRRYTRVVEYQLDEVNMVATKLWDWTEPQWSEHSLGGVDYTSGGGVLVTMGHIDDGSPFPGDHTTFVEIDPTTGEKLWEIHYGDSTDSAYRAQSVPPCDMFSNTKYCEATRTRLQELSVLGVTTD